MALRRRLAGLFMGCAVLILATQACGDDDDDSTRSDATKGESGASGSSEPMRRPTGGTGTTSSGVATDANGGSGAPVTDDSAYGCKPKMIDQGGSSRLKSPCCGGMGTCQRAETAGDNVPRDACSASDDLRCVPKAADRNGVDTSDAGLTPENACRVQLPGTPMGGTDYEGRCIEACFVQNSPIVSRLRQATCATSQLCAPCYSPLTGALTGVCERDGDAPIEPKPQGFAECGTGLGYCVPAYAAGTQANQLMQLTCAQGELCAPKIKAADPNACFDRCSSTLGPGACVPSFLAGAVGTALQQEACSENEVCAPCELFGQRFGVCD